MIKKYLSIIASNKIIKYLIVGGMAFVTEYLIFLLLIQVFLFPNALTVAQTVSFVAGLLISFFGNKIITFKDSEYRYKHTSASQFLKYLVLAGINLMLTNVFLYVLTNEFGLVPLVAKVAVMLAVVAWNFLIFQKFIFKVSD